jgi:hypothetical protein
MSTAAGAPKQLVRYALAQFFAVFVGRDLLANEIDELVWNDVKNNAVGRSRHDGPEDLHRAVLGRLRFLQKRPDRVRSFFQAPETRYAA